MAADQMSLLYDKAFSSLNSVPAEDSPFFWDRFKQSFNERVDEVYTDNFSPFSQMSRVLRNSDDTWQDRFDHFNDTAQDSLFKSLEYSFRDASLTLPLGVWADSRHDMMSDVFVNSVDAVEEESVSPLNSNYLPSERRWWKSIAAKRSIQYGVRPFSTSPYTYLSFRAVEAGRPVMLGHVRYFFRNFADHRFQLAISLPLAEGVALDMGTAYQFGPHEDEKKVVVKLSKNFRNGGVAHLGMELKGTPVLIAGITLPL